MLQDSRDYLTNLDQGICRVYIPEKLSQFDVQMLEEWFALIIKQARRRATPDTTIPDADQ